MEITFKGVKYTDAAAPADFMAPAPPAGTVPPSLLPTIEPGESPLPIISGDGTTMQMGPDEYPPIGFSLPPEMEAARVRNQSDIEILPTDHIDVYKIIHIDSAKALAHAFAVWDVDTLLDYDRGLRTSLCRALIDMAQRYQRAPQPTWVNMVENPDFFDKWRAELMTSLIEDDTDNPEAPGDSDPLPRPAENPPV